MNRFCFLLATMMIIWGSGKVVYSGTIEEDVASALAEIVSEKDIAKAIDKADQTRQLLSSRAGEVNSLQGNIFEADIALTMAKRYAAELNKDSGNSHYSEDARLLLEWAAESYGKLAEYARKLIEDTGENSRQNASSSRIEVFRDYFRRSVNSHGWCYYYLAKLNGRADLRKEFLSKAQNKFAVSIANNEQYNDLKLDSYSGLAICLIDQEKYFKASRLLDSLQFDFENISHKTHRWITYLMIRSSAEIKSIIDIENYAKRYMDSLSDGYSYEKIDIYIASTRLKALAELSRKTDKNPYYRSYLRRFEDECGKAFTKGDEMAVTAGLIMQKSGMDIGQKNKTIFDLARVSAMINNETYDQAKKLLGEIELEAIKSVNRLQQAAKLWHSLTSGFQKGTERWIECNFKRVECYMLEGKQKKANTLVSDLITEQSEYIPQVWINRFKAIVREAE